MSAYLSLNITEGRVLDRIFGSNQAGRVIRYGVPYLILRRK